MKNAVSYPAGTYCMFIASSVHFLQQVINCSDPVHSLVDYMDVLKFL